jgi:hypothetical protein
MQRRRPAADTTNQIVMTARCILFLAGTLACQALAGCDSRVPAPPDVRAEHAELVASLDENAPGLAVLRLQEFARRRERYAPALGVQQDIGRWQALLEPAYRKARDLARDGAFDEAERILVDLALVPDEPAGRLSRDFLAFEFHKLKASRLLVAGDAEGAETAARQALDRPLGDEQMAAAQQMLDTAALAKLGAEMTRTTALQSAARTVQVCLVSYFVEYGRYPERFTLEDPALEMARATRTVDVVARFEDYRADPETFSLIVVGRSGARFLVTDRTVEPAAPRAVMPK